MKEFVCFLKPRREDFTHDNMTEDEGEVMGRHFAYLKELCDKDVVLVAGPCLDSPPVGIVILRTEDLKEAQAIKEKDPSIVDRVMGFELRPFSLALLAK